jgi:PAS domain S-box-containing protein
MNPLRLAWKMLSDIELRTWVVALSALGVAVFALFATLGLRGAANSLELAADRMGADIVVVPAGAETKLEGALLTGVPAQFWMPAENVAKLKAIPGVEAVSHQVYLTTLKGASCCSVSEMFMIAYDPETDFTVRPWLEKQASSGLGLNEVIGGAHIAATEGNDRIRLYGDLVTLKGNLEPTGTWLDQSLFFTLDTAHHIARISETQGAEPLVIPPDQVSSVLVKTVPGADNEQVAVEILRTVPGVYPIQSADLFQSSRLHLTSLLKTVATTMTLIWPLAIVLIGMVFLIGAKDRRKDMRALRALVAEIAAREKAEERIRHLSSFPVLDPNPVLEIDASGTITFCNPGATNVLERLGLGDDACVFLPDDWEMMLAQLVQKRDVGFQREVQVGGAIFAETIQVIPSSNVMRLYTFEITQRKRAEEALRSTQLQLEAEKRHLEAVFHALPIGVVITDAQGGILFTNGMDEQIWGSRPITHHVDDYIQYQAWWVDSGMPVEPHEWASAQAVLKGESVFGQMLEIQRFDGGRGVVLNSAVPIRDNEGRIIGSAVVIQDITALRRAEEALRASEEKYRLLFQNMAEGFALYELLYDAQNQPADWRILEVNDAYSRHTGIARDRVVGRRISELFPEAIPEYLARFALVVATQIPSSFETYANAVGRHQHVSTFPAGGDRFASIIEDFTDRKRADDALHASEQKFATVFRFSPDAIGIARVADGVFLDVNDAFTGIMGYARSEIVGRTWRELRLVPVADDSARVEELFGAKGQVSDLELDLATKSGNVATLLVSIMPIAISGEPCVLVIAHDITERKRAEEALRLTQAELAAGIQARAAMEERQRLARELHDSVSQALYGISLGINTARTLFDTDRAKVLEALDYALSLTRGGLTEMRALIFELRPESLEMEGLVAALTKQIAALQVRHGIEVELNLCDEPDVPIAVKEAVYRIAQEALHNAIKHAQTDRLDIRLTHESDVLSLEVCDNGRGFDPLAAYPGHLGLRSMRERAISVGGSLDIASAQDRGTQIRARIPFAAPRAVQPG